MYAVLASKFLVGVSGVDNSYMTPLEHLDFRFRKKILLLYFKVRFEVF